jgi:hypothetical protein
VRRVEKLRFNQKPRKHVMETEPVWNSKRIGSRPGMRGGRSVEKFRLISWDYADYTTDYSHHSKLLKL